MICKECGKTNSIGVSFCKHCGAPQNSDIGQAPPQQNSRDETDESGFKENVEKLRRHKLLYADDEMVIDILGAGYISSIFAQESIVKSVMVCSNKRVYQKGRLFEKNFQGHITHYKGEKSVDLQEITGIAYLLVDPIRRLAWGLASLVIGIIGLLSTQEIQGVVIQYIAIVSGALLSFGLFSIVIYFFKRARWLTIEFAGGEIRTNCNWYKGKSVRRFMRSVATQKDLVVALKKK